MDKSAKGPSQMQSEEVCTLPMPYPVNRINKIYKDLYASIAEFFPKDDKPPVKKGICTFWKKLYRLPSAGQNSGGEIGFHYETLDEGFDKEGRYYWNIRFKASGDNDVVNLEFRHHLNSREGRITKSKEYDELGIPEYASLDILENGSSVNEVELIYNMESE